MATEYRTERLNLATFLHATRRLTLDRLELITPDKIAFVFLDPEERGAEFEASFEDGATVRAISLFASQLFLRRAMSDKKNQNHGAYNAKAYAVR
jgi:hypothetical protein